MDQRPKFKSWNDLEENTDEALEDTGTGKDFLNRTPKLQKTKGVHSYQLFNIILKILATALREGNKRIQISKEEVKLSLFAGDRILTIGNPKDFTKRLW